MANRSVTLEELPHVKGGLLAAGVNSLIEKCVLDCEDRPGYKNAREVVLKIKLSPVAQSHQGMTDLDTVNVDFEMSCSIPKASVPTISCSFRKHKNPDGSKGGGLVFNDMSEDDPRQRTIDELSE